MQVVFIAFSEVSPFPTVTGLLYNDSDLKKKTKDFLFLVNPINWDWHLWGIFSKYPIYTVG